MSDIMDFLYYFKIYLFIIFAILSGNTIRDLDVTFLNQMTKSWMQFLICLILSASFFDFSFKNWKTKVIEVTFVAVFAFITLQILRN